MVNGEAETDGSESLLPDRTAPGLPKMKSFITRTRRRGREKDEGEKCQEDSFTEGEEVGKPNGLQQKLKVGALTSETAVQKKVKVTFGDL